MKAYWIAIYKDLNNIENLKGYAEKAGPAIKKYNGKILVRGGKAETIEGNPSPRTVIIKFSNMQEALNCYNSDISLRHSEDDLYFLLVRPTNLTLSV